MSGSFSDTSQGSEKKLDVFTPNTLLICQQDSSTILRGDIKPAKTHLYADNTALYTAALIKPLKRSKLLQAHQLSPLQLQRACTMSVFANSCTWLSNAFIFLLNYVRISPCGLCGLAADKYIQQTSFCLCRSLAILWRGRHLNTTISRTEFCSSVLVPVRLSIWH